MTERPAPPNARRPSARRLGLGDDGHGESGGAWFGVLLCILPALCVAAHILLPDVVVLKILSIIVVLLCGSVFLSGLSETVSGASGFSLPLPWIGAVVVAGAALSFRFGWHSTLVVLGICAVFSVVGGLWKRKC